MARNKHLAIAAGCDGTESELPNKDWLLSSGWPPLFLSLCGPGNRWYPRRKREHTNTPTRPRHEVGVYRLTFQEPSSLPEEGQGGSRVRTHTERGLETVLGG